MWSCVKEFHFEYGHRIWSQSLDPKFAVDSKCACRFPHGHSGKAKVTMVAEELKDGMVTDFKNLNWFKKFIDEEVDHKFLIDRNDPLLFELLSHLDENSLGRCYAAQGEGHAKYQGDLDLNEAQLELYQGIVIVPFLPTSENLSRWFYDIASKKMKEIGIKIEKVEFYETQKSYSSYQA